VVMAVAAAAMITMTMMAEDNPARVVVTYI
jgi:hypothetical protein